MIKYVCDACGKEASLYSLFNVRIVPPEIKKCGEDTEELDICRDCMEAGVRISNLGIAKEE